MPIDWKKPIQTKSGDKVRVLCIDAGGLFPVVGLADGVVRSWNMSGFSAVYENYEEDPYELLNSPPPEKFYIHVREDGSYQSDVQGLTHTPTDMARITVNPENKTIHIEKLNDTEIFVVGVTNKKPIIRSNESRGDLMSGYFKTLQGREPSGIMIDNPMILGEADNDE